MVLQGLFGSKFCSKCNVAYLTISWKKGKQYSRDVDACVLGARFISVQNVQLQLC